MTANIEEYIKNPIKRHVIGEIMKRGKLRYSELMPEDIDNVLLFLELHIHNQDYLTLLMILAYNLIQDHMSVNIDHILHIH